jgi:hypothetical protein
VLDLTFNAELETSLVMSQDSVSLDLQVQVSDLHIKHLKDVNHFSPVNEALLVTVKYILTVVSRKFSNSKGLNSRLMELYRRLSSGTIFSVRRVEIELLHAGRVSYSVGFSRSRANHLASAALPPQYSFAIMSPA